MWTDQFPQAQLHFLEVPYPVVRVISIVEAVEVVDSASYLNERSGYPRLQHDQVLVGLLVALAHLFAQISF